MDVTRRRFLSGAVVGAATVGTGVAGLSEARAAQRANARPTPTPSAPAAGPTAGAPATPAAHTVTPTTWDEARGQTVHWLSVSNSSDPSFTPYDATLQASLHAGLQTLKASGTWTVDAPLLVLDPYATSTTALYLHTTAVAGALEYTVSSAELPDFRARARNVATDGSFEGLVVGIVPGVANHVTLRWQPEGPAAKPVEFDIKGPASRISFPPRVSREVVGDVSVLAQGLYYLNGPESGIAVSPLVDNEGVTRGELLTNSYRLLPLDGDIVMMGNVDTAVRLDGLGRPVEIWPLGQFSSHHDLNWSSDTSAVLILATDKSKKSILDVVVRLDLATGTITKVLDLSTLLADYQKLTTPAPTLQDPSTPSWDWVHVNAIDCAGTTAYLSSRETSTVIVVDDMDTVPTLHALVGLPDVWAGTAYEDKAFALAPGTVPPSGQHCVSRVDDASLARGRYYLDMFDNQFWSYASRPAYTGSHAPDASADISFGSQSSLRRYLVDDRARTLKLVEEISSPYSCVVSSVQRLGRTVLIAPGKAKRFVERTPDGRSAATFTYPSNDLLYRCLKYDFVGTWFAT
jgi:arylsulfate sulfotransferase